MSTPVQITNHVQQAISKILTPFRNRPRFAAWCKAPVTQVQVLENVVYDFLALLDVDVADLPRLILLGKIVGQTQRGTLEQFRSYVKVRILVNRSRGSAPDLIKIARIMLGAGEVEYTEYSPASIVIESRASLAGFDPYAISDFLNLARLGGVRLDFVAQDETDDFSFLLGDDAAAGVVDTNHGLSDESESSGGYLAGVY